MANFSRDTVVKARAANFIVNDNLFLQVITTTSNAAQTSNDMFLLMSDVRFTISGLTGETVTLNYVDLDQKVVPTAVRPLNVTTGHENATTTLGNGTYYLRLTDIDSFRKLQFTKSAAVETVTIAICAVKQYNP